MFGQRSLPPASKHQMGEYLLFTSVVAFQKMMNLCFYTEALSGDFSLNLSSSCVSGKVTLKKCDRHRQHRVERKITTNLLHPDVCHPPDSALYFSHRSHGGILEPTDCSFSPTLDCCDTHAHTHAHTYTHTPSLTRGSDIHSHTGRHPLSFQNTQSPFTLQNPHTPRPVWLGTLHQHTHAPTHARPDTHARVRTHMHTSQRAPRLIAPPFGWCHLFHTFCRRLTESCCELVVL